MARGRLRWFPESFFRIRLFSDLVFGVGRSFVLPPDRSFRRRGGGNYSSNCKGLVMKLFNQVKKFLKSEDGPTAVEYAVMLALIVIVCLTAIQAIGTNANVTFNSVASKLGTTGGS